MNKTSAGIDLGTTNSCLAFLDGDEPKVIPNDLGKPITPSVVSVQADGVVVGQKARSFVLTHPANTFVSIKRRMGERYTRNVLGKDYTPESVSALVLGHLKQYGEKQLGRTLEEVVITVPANFNSTQRQATKDAGEIAGFNVLRVVNEPTAAALAYGHEHKLSAVLVVFDLGGGTFDISVVEAGDGLYEVLHSAGDNHLGGDDFNLRIVTWIVQEFQKQSGLDIRRDVPAMQLAHEWAVAAKHTLTANPEVRIKIDDLYKGKSFDAVLTRTLFEELSKDLFDRLRSIARTVNQELTKPKFREAHGDVFDNQMQGCDILLVGGETRVPAVRKLVRDIFKGNIHTDVNPDEVVAMGAALQAGIIHKQGGVKDIILVDTTALTLGVGTHGDIYSPLIEGNTKIPCTRTKDYQPIEDFQASIVFPIYQGESEIASKNVRLGEIELMLQPPRKKQDAPVDITFHLDANDILHVSAIDRKTGTKQTVTIRDSQNLDREMVQKLKREALASQQEDRLHVQRVHRRQRLRDFQQEVQDQVRLLKHREPNNKFVEKAEEYALRLGRALSGEDDRQIDQTARDLEAVWQKLLDVLPPVDERRPVGPETVSPADDQIHTAHSSHSVLCGNCGARVPPGFAFCGKCGCPLKKDKCGRCGAALVEGFKFCGKCGEKVD